MRQCTVTCRQWRQDCWQTRGLREDCLCNLPPVEELPADEKTAHEALSDIAQAMTSLIGVQCVTMEELTAHAEFLDVVPCEPLSTGVQCVGSVDTVSRMTSNDPKHICCFESCDAELLLPQCQLQRWGAWIDSLSMACGFL